MINIAKELKTLMIRRRRVDLAAGIVLAGAFRSAMTSLIHDVILPPVSTVVTGTNLSNLSYVIKKPTAGMPPVVIGYGRFLQASIDFLIIGATVVVILRIVDNMSSKAESMPSKQEELLKEIRDLLRLQLKA
jgi:large conductance mechanosensitive channel